jgi:hypothetical protein
MSSYGALKVIAYLYYFCAALIFTAGLIVGILGIIGVLSAPPALRMRADITPAVMVIVTTVITAVSLTAVGQIIFGFIELIDNSREQVRLLRFLAKSEAAKRS